MERWIYGFRCVGTRRLTREELEEAKRRERRESRLRWGYGALSLLLAVAALAGFFIQFEHRALGLALLVGAGISFFFALARASRSETCSLMARRAARTGRLDQFVYEGAPAAVREAYALLDPELGAFDFWSDDERLLRLVNRLAGGESSFETTPDDDNVVRVGRYWAERVFPVQSVLVSVDHSAEEKRV